LTKYSSFLVNSHILTLDSLSAGATYHYQVISSDGVNSTTSEDNTFATESDAPAGGSTPSNPSAQNTTVVGTTADANASVPTVAAVSASSVQKTVDASIAAPTLTSVTIGDKKTDAPIVDQQSVTSGFVVIVNGKSFANAAIALMIGDKAFPGTADKDGAWQIAINSGELAIGDYTVKAQAQDTKKNKGSQIVDLFPLKVAEKVVAAETSESQVTPITKTDDSLWSKITGKYKWYFLAAAVVLLAGLGTGSYFLIKKLKAIKKAKSIQN
jgi:hypothetical protein